MTRLNELRAHGQSIWLDYISRGFISKGELDTWIGEGLMGLTSNPSIFEKVIAEGSEYRDELATLVATSKSAEEIYERLAIEDIRRATDCFREVYETSGGRDGLVSLEVSPELAHDTDRTLEAARRLWRSVQRPNLMIKVPGTPEGLIAMEILVSEGISVNVTLLFSVSVYEAAAAGYIAGLRRRAAAGEDIRRVASVASFFVSRVDTAVDAILESQMKEAATARQSELNGLRGKTAIANAKLAYARYRQIFSNEAWWSLAEKGAQTQRVLWASTGTKNPEYRDVLYIEELIGRDTVSTVPPTTLAAFRDHGRVRDSLTEDLQGARSTIDALNRLGISLDDITRRLLVEGERQFLSDYRRLLAAVERASSAVVTRAGVQR